MGGRKGKPPHKRPTFQESLAPVEDRRPRIHPASDRQTRPAWLFQRLDFQGRWSWTMDAPTLQRVLVRLAEFERMTFGELEGKQNHEIPRGRLCSDAQKRLNELELDESWDMVLSLRVTGRQRVWGLKSPEGVLLLWWDPDHTVYPVNVADN